MSTTSSVALCVPDVSSSKSYTVQAGDYSSGIAAETGVTIDDLIAVNGWSDGTGHVIHPGDVLVLPAGATEPRSTPTAGSSPKSQAGALEYLEVDPGALLGVGPDGTTTPIDDPLGDGIGPCG